LRVSPPPEEALEFELEEELEEPLDFSSLPPQPASASTAVTASRVIQRIRLPFIRTVAR
jgi:hypothetical protein